MNEKVKMFYGSLYFSLFAIILGPMATAFIPHPNPMIFHGGLESASIFKTYVALSPSAISNAATDLTPAVDKFVRMPTAADNRDYCLRAKGPEPVGPDPFKLVAEELSPLSDYVKELVVSENPVLTKAASHFFEQRQGKRFRPTLVALLARCLSGTSEHYQHSALHRKQLQLGQITEMIHVASLIHDDVLDEAETRRGGQAVHAMYSNKVAVLAGDYLLARASVLLARLQHFAVVEVMASALDALVQGEIMQARSKGVEQLDMVYYLRKSYFKTASLLTSAARSTALLAGYDDGHEVTQAAEEYGYHLGMAYQIVDDILDFSGASAGLGKPAQADMALGLATAPLLFAAESRPELRPLIERRFREGGDVVRAVSLAKSTDCLARSYDLAEFHADRAGRALYRLPPGEARDALMRLLYVAIARDK